MSVFFEKLNAMTPKVIIGFLVGVLSIVIGMASPAYAGTSQSAVEYVAADGSDLTAVAECLPKQLSQPSLGRALRESGNDFLEKVFSLKDEYGDYKLDEAEIAYLTCLKEKGVTPQVER
jgi:hypothetical protein